MRVAISAALLLCVGCSFAPPSAPSAGPPTSTAGKARQVDEKPIPVDMVDLCKEYSANPIAADSKYKGRLLELDMRVPQITKNSQGEDVLWGWYVFPHGDFDPNIEARINPTKLEPFAKLKAGSWLVIRGICDGMERSRGSYKEFIIKVSQCELVRVKQESK